MKASQTSALINLLDDTDNVVYNAVEEKLLSSKENIIPDLKIALSLSNNTLFIERATFIIHSLRKINLDKELSAWSKDDSRLLYGAFLIAQYKYTDVIFEDIETELFKVVDNIKNNTNFYSLTPLQQIHKINYFLFEKERFAGDFSNITKPENSFINNVVKSKKGNDITIAIIYISVAHLLGIPICGIDFPGNFLVVYESCTENIEKFYINPINKGGIIAKKDITKFLKNNRIKAEYKHYSSCSNKTIIKRLLKFLMQSYIKKNDADNMSDIKRILRLLKN